MGHILYPRMCVQVSSTSTQQGPGQVAEQAALQAALGEEEPAEGMAVDHSVTAMVVSQAQGSALRLSGMPA